MRDMRIYAEIVQQIRLEEAERERLIRAARANRKKEDAVLQRLIRFFRGRKIVRKPLDQEPVRQVGATRHEPAI